MNEIKTIYSPRDKARFFDLSREFTTGLQRNILTYRVSRIDIRGEVDKSFHHQAVQSLADTIDRVEKLLQSYGKIHLSVYIDAFTDKWIIYFHCRSIGVAKVVFDGSMDERFIIDHMTQHQHTFQLPKNNTLLMGTRWIRLLSGDVVAMNWGIRKKRPLWWFGKPYYVPFVDFPTYATSGISLRRLRTIHEQMMAWLKSIIKEQGKHNLDGIYSILDHVATGNPEYGFERISK